MNSLIQASRDRRNRTPPARRGMTLVEVLAVVIILGLIAATLTLSFRGQVGRAKRELAKTGIALIVNAIETYALETGAIPTMEDGLDVLTRAPAGRAEPFLKPDKLIDPWGHRYQYVTPGPQSAYQVLSLGADGRPGVSAGGAGSEDEDISSDQLGQTTKPAGGKP